MEGPRIYREYIHSMYVRNGAEWLCLIAPPTVGFVRSAS
jgi:hypothetical protein